MKKLYKILVGSGAISLSPLIAFAQPVKEAGTIADLFGQINAVINTIIPFLVGLAVLVIIWGVFNYIVGAGDEEKRAEAKTYIVWGIIGVFIMLSIWGLVNVIVNSFKLKKTPIAETEFPQFGQPGVTPSRIAPTPP